MSDPVFTGGPGLRGENICSWLRFEPEYISRGEGHQMGDRTSGQALLSTIFLRVRLENNLFGTSVER
jgi:hypothetical protein